MNRIERVYEVEEPKKEKERYHRKGENMHICDLASHEQYAFRDGLLILNKSKQTIHLPFFV